MYIRARYVLKFTRQKENKLYYGERTYIRYVCYDMTLGKFSYWSPMSAIINTMHNVLTRIIINNLHCFISIQFTPHAIQWIINGVIDHILLNKEMKFNFSIEK